MFTCQILQYDCISFILQSDHPHTPFFITSMSSIFDFALFLCVTLYLPLALLPELVTNVPIQRLVKCLYSKAASLHLTQFHF